MDVLIVDDHPLLQEMLPAVVRKAFGDCTIHVTGDLAEALERASGKVDLALLDLGLPGCAGIEALTRLRARNPGMKVIVVSSADDGTIVRAALKAGAAAYIPKTSKLDVMLAALQLVKAGGTYVPREAMEGGRGAGPVALSQRQLEVLRLMQKGLSNRGIARELQIAESTVKQHIGVIYEVLGVTTRAEAIVAAARLAASSG